MLKKPVYIIILDFVFVFSIQDFLYLLFYFDRIKVQNLKRENVNRNIIH